MLAKGIKYEFTAKPWQYKGKGAWYFISLPLDFAKEIRENLKWQEQGWGRMRATAKIGKTEWETAIWFDTKLKTYLLPINWYEPQGKPWTQNSAASCGELTKPLVRRSFRGGGLKSEIREREKIIADREINAVVWI